MLTAGALAQVESQFVLCSSHLSEYIVIRFPLEQSVADLGMAVVGCIV